MREAHAWLLRPDIHVCVVQYFSIGDSSGGKEHRVFAPALVADEVFEEGERSGGQVVEEVGEGGGSGVEEGVGGVGGVVVGVLRGGDGGGGEGGGRVGKEG